MKTLSARGLYEEVRNCFSKVKEDVSNKVTRAKMPLVDCLMSALAIFSLKYPSLLKFDQDREGELLRHNLKHLYGINKIPSDTYMRERLDDTPPKNLRKAFKKLFSQVQRGKFLKLFEYMDESYLLSLDGTGYFSSDTVHCKNCCTKHHKDGRISYYHQMLSGALVHPDLKVVLPFAPEPISKTDGATKNDCERNAAKRFLEDFRREHPHLKIIVVEDGLSSNAPHIRELEKHKMSYILVAKESDHKNLFEEFRALPGEEYEIRRNGKSHKFRFVNKLSLNDANPDCIVNVLEYLEIPDKGKARRWVWVTDIHLSKNNVYQIMRGGRARWKIENETFNTLKNQGYQFEHNFGHGKRHLSTVFAYLMLLAFLIDQLQQLCCKQFKKALKKWKTKSRLWDKMKNYFFSFLIDSWDDFMTALAIGHKTKLILDTS